MTKITAAHNGLAKMLRRRRINSRKIVHIFEECRLPALLCRSGYAKAKKAGVACSTSASLETLAAI